MQEFNQDSLVKKFVFNKSKNKSIIFIHGLFGNSGFWLPFLTYFNQFKILILDINYPKLFEDYQKDFDFNKYFNSILETDDEYVLISHSMGTIISQFLSSSVIKISYEICPIYNVERINNDLFVNQIKSRVNLSSTEINKILINSTLFIDDNSASENTSMNKIQYLPFKDQFFMYSKDFNTIKYFDGNHFEISNSLLMIKADLFS